MAVFVSHDAEGTEVHVATSEGFLVKDVEDKGQTTHVTLITPPGHPTPLKYPVTGYVSHNSPDDLTVINELQAAKEAQSPVSVRIETVRRPHVDKSIPINEVRSGEATKDVIRRLVGVNGKYTSERLTSPAHDPKTGGGVPVPLDAPAPSTVTLGGTTGVDKGTALNVLRSVAANKAVSDNMIDALKAQAMLAGADYDEITAALTLDNDTNSQTEVRSNYAKESPSWRDYNADGRLNLGNGSVATAVGTYGFVYNTLFKTHGEEGVSEENVAFYTELILSLADTIQSGAYGKGFIPDRGASSHIRIRSILFNIIEATQPLLLSGDNKLPEYQEAFDWMQKLGRTARTQFLTSIELSQQKPAVIEVIEKLNQANADAGGFEANTPENAPAETTGAEAQTPNADSEDNNVAEQQEQTVPPEPVYDDSASEPSQEEDDTPMVFTNATTAATPEASADSSSLEVPLPEPTHLPSGYLTHSNQPSEETLEQFKSFVIDEVGYKTKDEQVKVSKLLAYMFGKNYAKASSIPEDELGEFLDYYIASGVEVFRSHIEEADKLLP